MYQAKIPRTGDREAPAVAAGFIKLFPITEFGLKSIADKNMKALVAGAPVRRRLAGNISVNTARILVFGEMAGMGDGNTPVRSLPSSHPPKADLTSMQSPEGDRGGCRLHYGLRAAAVWNTKTIRDKLNTEECLVPYDHASAACTPSLPPLPYSTVCGLTVVWLARAQL